MHATYTGIEGTKVEPTLGRVRLTTVIANFVLSFPVLVLCYDVEACVPL